MAPAPPWTQGPLPYRATAPAQGLLLAEDPAVLGHGSAAAGGALIPAWALRRDSLFGPGPAAGTEPAAASAGAADPVTDFFAGPRAWEELRLCAGPAAGAGWAALAALVERLREAEAPPKGEGVLRLELVFDGAEPEVPPAGALARLRAVRPLFVHVWIQEAAQATAEAARAWAALLDAGLPVAAEIPLERGRGDSVAALRELCRKLLEARVRPYVLVDGAWLPPERRVPVAAAEALVRGLRGWISGLAVPQWVQEDVTGARRVRIPVYVRHLDAAGVEVESYLGTRHRYPNPPED